MDVNAAIVPSYYEEDPDHGISSSSRLNGASNQTLILIQLGFFFQYRQKAQ